MKKVDPSKLSPFGQYCHRHEYTDEDVSQMISEITNGKESCCPRYVRHLHTGIRDMVNYEIAKAMSAITLGELSAVEILEWRRPVVVVPVKRKAKRRAA